MPLSSAHLPVIADPGLPAGTDPSSLYASGPQASAVFNDLEGIEYTFTTLTNALQVFCMFDGMVTYLPPNTSYNPVVVGYTVNSEVSTGGKGGALLEVLPNVDTELTKKVPGGVPAPVYILIEGIEPVSFRSDMGSIIALVPEPILDVSWLETESSDPTTIARSVKESKYLDRLMLAEKQLFVDGSENLGLTELEANGNPRFTVKMYFTEIQFAANTYKISKISPLGFFKYFPNFIDPNNPNTTYFSKWHNHPLVSSVEDFNELTIKAFIKFEVWNPNPIGSAGDYVPVDSGITVKMMDYDPGSAVDPIQIVTTDTNGMASFSVPVPDDGWMGGNPDIFFTIISPTASAANGLSTLPSEWSTKTNGIGTTYWLSVDGRKGYYDEFDGHTIGSPNNPLIFRIGVDFHVQFKHYNYSKSRYEVLTDGILVEMYSDIPSLSGPAPLGDPVFSYTIDNGKGEIHGVVFDVYPENETYWRIYYAAEDSSIKLNSEISFLNEGLDFNFNSWLTYAPDTQYDSNMHSHLIYPDKFKKLQYSTIGSKSNPIIFKTLAIQDSSRRFGFHTLKLSRELAVFYNLMTNNAYIGINTNYRFTFVPFPIIVDLPKIVQQDYSLGLATYPQIATPYAWPVDYVNLTDLENYWWNRDTVIHESSHHVYWHTVDFGTMNIISAILPWGGLYLIHAPRLITNNQHSLIEGFPESIEGIFDGSYPLELLSTSTPGIYTLDLRDLDRNRNIPGTSIPYELGPSINTSIDFGETIEGIVGNCIVDIFWELVVSPYVPYSVHNKEIVESTDGNIITKNSWLSISGISLGFINILWSPLQALFNSGSNPSSTEFFNNIISQNPSISHKIRGILNSYNVRIEAPVIQSSSDTTGSVGDTIALTGFNFVDDFSNHLNRRAWMVVKFGTVAVPDVDLGLINSNEISVITPPGTGTVSISIELHIDSNTLSFISGSVFVILGSNPNGLTFTYV